MIEIRDNDLTLPLASRKHWRLACLIGAVLTSICLSAAPVKAQEAQEESRFPAERMRSTFDSEGIIGVESATTPGHLKLNLGLWGGYAKSPVVLRDDDGNRLGTLLSDRAGGAVFGSVGLGDSFLLGVELPLVFYQGRRSNTPAAVAPLAAIAMGGIGDIRISGKWAPLMQRTGSALNLAVILGVTVPSGGGEAYRGDSLPTLTPELALSRYFADNKVRLGGNLSLTGRASVQMLNQKVESEGGYGLGIAYIAAEPGGRPLELAASASGAFSLLQPFQNINQTPLEARAQIGHALNDSGLFAYLGGGAGIVPGWGTPDWRAFLGLRWSTVERKPCPETECPSCPTLPDRDGDGIPDAYDLCPDEAGPAQNAGCPLPEPEQKSVAVEADHIEIQAPVNFAFNSDQLDPSSYAILDEVAEVFRNHPEIELVQVEGHTDDRGNASYNLRLSQRRATTVVRYLSSKGVELERLIPRGYGATQPIASNDTEEGRNQNRRVVFTILRRASNSEVPMPAENSPEVSP